MHDLNGALVQRCFVTVESSLFSGRMSWNTSEDVLRASWLRISLASPQLLARPQGVGEEVAFGLLQLPKLVKGSASNTAVDPPMLITR